MTRRRRKIPAVDQLDYMKARGDNSCTIKIQRTDHDRLMIVINQKCAYLDEVETYQLIRALHRVGTAQFGVSFHDHCLNYMDGVTVFEEVKA